MLADALGVLARVTMWPWGKRLKGWEGGEIDVPAFPPTDLRDAFETTQLEPDDFVGRTFRDLAGTPAALCSPTCEVLNRLREQLHDARPASWRLMRPAM